MRPDIQYRRAIRIIKENINKKPMRTERIIQGIRFLPYFEIKEINISFLTQFIKLRRKKARVSKTVSLYKLMRDNFNHQLITTTKLTKVIDGTKIFYQVQKPQTEKVNGNNYLRNSSQRIYYTIR